MGGGYADIPEVMLIANLQLFFDFIENEKYGISGLEDSISYWEEDKIKITAGEHDEWRKKEDCIAEVDRYIKTLTDELSIYIFFKVTVPALEAEYAGESHELYSGVNAPKHIPMHDANGDITLYQMDFDQGKDIEKRRNELRKKQGTLEKDIDSNLIKIMKLRRSLWT
jgi:hypothetical protein